MTGKPKMSGEGRSDVIVAHSRLRLDQTKRKFGIRGLLVCLIVSVGGCAISPSRNELAIAELKKIAAEQAEASRNPQFEALRGVTTFNAREITPSMMVMTDHATEEQRSALLRAADLAVGWNNRVLDAIRGTDVSYAAPIYQADVNRRLAALLMLYHRKITWGEYHRQLKENYDAYTAAFQVLAASHSLANIPYVSTTAIVERFNREMEAEAAARRQQNQTITCRQQGPFYNCHF